jgi:hypothetical protein
MPTLVHLYPDGTRISGGIGGIEGVVTKFLSDEFAQVARWHAGPVDYWSGPACRILLFGRQRLRSLAEHLAPWLVDVGETLHHRHRYRECLVGVGIE